MKFLQSIFVIAVIIAVSSCRKDFSTVPNFGKLQFSKDTVFLDTIFTNIGSATYNLKVYNRSNKAITIPQIQLENGNSSNYRLNVDGIPGKNFTDININAKDSIYVFVETTVDVSSEPNPLYTDKILFDSGDNQQDVDLVTLVKDATFIFPGKDPVSMEIDKLLLNGEQTTLQGRFLEDSELVFTSNKPYVIYGYAVVPSGKTLTIEAGARIHFHNDSGLIIDNGGSLKVMGTLNEKVIFEGDRLENSFSTITGQWGTIWMRENSEENQINHAIIKNGVIGLLVDGNPSAAIPKLQITNTEIYNHASFGVLGRQTSISGSNLVIGNAGQSSFAGTVGGSYNFTHTTFANYWNNSLRTLPAVLVNNFFTFQDDMGNDVIETGDLSAANFTNCIIHGGSSIEFVLDRVDNGSLFNYNVQNCLIKFDDFNNTFANNNELDFTNTARYQNIILNGNPNFKSAFDEEFIIGKDSDAVNQGISTPITLDILGVTRSTPPDLGAYQSITFN